MGKDPYGGVCVVGGRGFMWKNCRVFQNSLQKGWVVNDMGKLVQGMWMWILRGEGSDSCEKGRVWVALGRTSRGWPFIVRGRIEDVGKIEVEGSYWVGLPYRFLIEKPTLEPNEFISSCGRSRPLNQLCFYYGGLHLTNYLWRQISDVGTFPDM